MRFLTFAVLATLVAGCDDEPTNPPDDGFFLRITYSPAAVNIPLHNSETMQLVVTRGGLYPGSITLTAEGLPATVIATFNPAILTGTTDRSTLTLTSGQGNTAGPCPFTIRATGPEVDDAVTPTISCVVTGQ
jgi:hypothetical protein